MTTHDHARVVVTGVGAVTPIGNTACEFWDALVQGRSGVAPIAAFDAARARPSYAAEVKRFAAELAGVPQRKLKMMGRQAQLACAAVHDACTDAALVSPDLDCRRIGIVLGVGMLNADVSELGRVVSASGMGAGPFDLPAFSRAAATQMFPLWLLRHIPNLAAAHASICLDAQGPSNTIATGCVAGANAIGEAYRIVRRGEADVVLAGGADARVSPLATLRYRDLGWLSTRDDVSPVEVSAPLDASASGFVNGEGAGIVVLESLEHARRRGARIRAELVGYAAANEAHDLLSPRGDGAALARAARHALDRACVLPSEVDVVFAPAASVPAFDRAVACGLVSTFGRQPSRATVTATRSLVGHTHAASAALDSVAAIMAIGSSQIPPTINVRRPIAALAIAADVARASTVSTALVGAYGFGGHAASLMWREYAA
jgi:3-oxoacyl-[acyl-carrier-protein] synthase II